MPKGIGAPGSFATRSTVAVDDLHLELKGVGRIRLPVSAAAARKLCAAARPARHGFKEQTRLDPKVRDTWEIPKSRISIDQRRWKKTLGPALEQIRGKLGLPETCRLKAELHNLLIYAPGQFFVTHQDSEKADDMVGTLVVSLPSKCTGGSFMIEHHEEKRRIGDSDTKLTLIAFYAERGCGARRGAARRSCGGSTAKYFSRWPTCTRPGPARTTTTAMVTAGAGGPGATRTRTRTMMMTTRRRTVPGATRTVAS